ncbi:MAG: molybdopterin synthase sulfur carrier subunit, partial [Vicinamibacterales bacterium]
MSCIVLIPGPLRELARHRAQVSIDGSADSVGGALSLLWKECPGVRDRVLTELGEVRPHVNIFVDGENIRYSGGMS